MSLQRLTGVFLGSHAVAEGAVTRAQLQSGLYRRLFQNVYADPGLPLDHQLLARGAMLVMPDDAVLGGRSAAAWYDAPFATPADPVLVLVPPTSAWRGPRGIRVHRTEVASGEVRLIENAREAVRVTTPLRTAWEIGTLERVGNAVALLDAMVGAQHLTYESLERLAREGRGRWGSRRFSKVVPLVDGRSQSRPESLVRVACVRAGLPAPVPQFVVQSAGRWLGQVDLAWPEHRLIVEYEGPHHFEEHKIVQDDGRYARLIAAGWRVIRLSTADLWDLDGVVARIRQALALPLLAG
ncbi:DUF559 domain-containing protein [Blastococcus jejuensis]|uniref:DUF559 domain-containing protein n=1 Tax=Blastococcus jejuensis TaxID=351224 RepID=UPI0031DB4FD0